MGVLGLANCTVERARIRRVHQNSFHPLHDQVRKLSDLLVDIGIPARVLDVHVIAELLGFIADAEKYRREPRPFDVGHRYANGAALSFGKSGFVDDGCSGAYRYENSHSDTNQTARSHDRSPFWSPVLTPRYARTQSRLRRRTKI